MADSAGPRSHELYERAVKSIPGGVSSPVRAFRAVGGTPLYLSSGRGATVKDADGRTYLDFVGSWGPLILGHAHAEVVERVCEAAARGLTFGTPCEDEVLLAEKLTGLYPGLEQVRFVSSGTEAAMSALRLARGVTGRDLIVKFAGCYHGHSDQLLVAAGSGLATFGTPDSKGVPAAYASLTHVLPLDDETAIDHLFADHGNKIAAVIIEPVPANNGLLLQRREYLNHLREVTRAQGALLIFDEVISGFRLGPGGAAAYYGITPDLAAFGKVIGGGMPVGAFGGRRELMEALAPSGGVYQAGTLSGNPVAMAAGRATLDILERDDCWTKLAEKGTLLKQKFDAVTPRTALAVQLVQLGSLFWLYFGADPPPRTADKAVSETGAAAYARQFHSLLDRHIYIAPSAYEVGFLSMAHEAEDLDTFVRAFVQSVG